MFRVFFYGDGCFLLSVVCFLLSVFCCLLALRLLLAKSQKKSPPNKRQGFVFKNGVDF